MDRSERRPRPGRIIGMNLVALALFVAAYTLLDLPVPYTITWRGTVDTVFEGGYSLPDQPAGHVMSAYPFSIVVWAPLRATVGADSRVAVEEYRLGVGQPRSILVIRRLGVTCSKVARFGGLTADCPPPFSPR
jgi:hypothetical protein